MFESIKNSFNGWRTARREIKADKKYAKQAVKATGRSWWARLTNRDYIQEELENLLKFYTEEHEAHRKYWEVRTGTKAETPAAIKEIAAHRYAMQMAVSALVEMAQRGERVTAKMVQEGTSVVYSTARQAIREKLGKEEIPEKGFPGAMPFEVSAL
jgi:hypothetical protein